MSALVSAPTIPSFYNMQKGKGRAEASSEFASSASATTLTKLVQDHQEQYHYNIGRAQNHQRRQSTYNRETAPPVPLIPVPAGSTAGSSHYSRSSISSTASHIIFSPDRSAQPAVVLDTPLSDFQRRERINEERKQRNLPPLTPPTPDPYDTPAVKMPIPYISHLSAYLAEMIVYLWYSPPKFKRGLPFPKPSTGFIKFCHDTLLTTQLSQSVVVLALFFIWKLQSKHCIDPAPGSEFKLAVVSLMLANKVLDDHTYTNRTWSDVTNMPLGDLNDSEKEFLQGLDFSLYVSRTAFSAWVELLERPNTAAFHPNSRQRKRPRIEKVAPTIPPSAPTSPVHPSSACSASRSFAFDFAVPNPTTNHNTLAPPIQQHYQQQASYQIPPSAVASSSASQMLTVPQSSAPYHVEQQQRQHTPASSPFSYTQSGQLQASFGPHAGVSATKKRKLSNPSLPAEFFYERRPSSAQTPVQGWQNQAAGLPHAANHSSIYPIDSMAQSQYLASGSAPATGGVNYSVPDADQAADFSTLTSKFSPIDEIAGRSNPETLAYYALAAGQQRGGILAYQPVGQRAPGFTPAIQYDHNSAVGHALLYAPEQAQRQIAALPHQAYQHTQQEAPQAATAAPSVYAPIDSGNPYSLSPAILRSSSYGGEVQPQGMLASAPPQGDLSLPPPSVHYQDAGRQYGMPAPAQTQEQLYPQDYAAAPTQAYPNTYATQQYYAGDYDQNYQDSAPAPVMVQNAHAPVAAPTYYSSFSNNGLPGVVQWPAKYATTINTVPQMQIPSTAWPRQSSYTH